MDSITVLSFLMADSMLASTFSILEGGVGSHEKCIIKEEGVSRDDQCQMSLSLSKVFGCSYDIAL